MNKSAALFISVILLTQVASYSFNEVQSDLDRNEFTADESWEVSGRNNSSGNNTGGNNTGGNNTNSNNDSHCLTVGNFSMSSTYSVTLDLVNVCSFDLNYPGVNISADHSGVSGFSNQTNWVYLIGSNATYNFSWQLTFDSSVQNGTNITLDFEAAILNCGTNGTSHDCPTSNNSTLSYQFQYVKPPTSLVIYSALMDFNNSASDRISLRYNSQNYSGTVTWEYDSSNGTSTSYSYASSSLRTTYIYPTTFGLIEICGSIPGDTTCVNVTRNIRPLSGSINTPVNNFTTNLSSVYVSYYAENYSNGAIELNNQIVDYLPTYNSNGNNNTNNSSSNNLTNGTYVNLPTGWSTICLTLTGDNNTTLSDCVQVYRIAPTIRLIIDSAVLYSNNNYVMLRYHSENYSGYVDWTYDSSNGTSASSSYTSSSVRTTYLSLSTFGTIQICGSIDNSTSECVSVNRTARTVEGHLISPSNNSQYYSSYAFIEFTANNYSTGYITLNSQNYNYLYSGFYDYNNTNSTWGTGNNGTSTPPIYGNLSVQIPYGFSSICLELTGEDGTQLSDCITVERYVPPHSVSITYPAAGVSFTGQYLSLSYTLENSSSHHFTVDGTSISPTENNSSMVQLNVGFGTSVICVVSYDFASIEDSDCVTVTMIDPNADTDSDGVIDTSDLCPNTPINESVNYDGCSTSQLDTDIDGVTDNLDLCPNTLISSSVDTNGCAAYQRDTDGDGIMDNLDACPSTPANSVVDVYGCANTQTDSDNDGIADSLDLCPNTLVGSQVDANGCAPSQLDSDSDGIVDSFDQCPGTAVGTVVDQTGCAPSNTGNNSGSGNSSSEDSSSEEDSGGLPSIGVIGTLGAIAVSFVAVIRREQEE